MKSFVRNPFKAACFSCFSGTLHANIHLFFFTLIELLAIVSIIAVLISILLPSLSSARKTTRMLQCANNEKQIGTAMFSYIADFSDYFPPYFQGAAHIYNWNYGLYDLSYLKNNKIYYCSETGNLSSKYSQLKSPENCVSMPSQPYTYGYISYGYNYQWIGSSYGFGLGNPYPTLKSSLTKNPSSKIFMIEARWSDASSDGIRGSYIAKAPFGSTAKVHPRHNATNYENGKVNCIWLDGHVTTIAKYFELDYETETDKYWNPYK